MVARVYTPGPELTNLFPPEKSTFVANWKSWLEDINREKAVIRRGKISVTTPAVGAFAIVSANVAIANVAGAGLEPLDTGDRILAIYYDAAALYIAPPILTTDVWATSSTTMDGLFTNPTAVPWAGGAIDYYIQILKYSNVR